MVVRETAIAVANLKVALLWQFPRRSPCGADTLGTVSQGQGQSDTFSLICNVAAVDVLAQFRARYPGGSIHTEMLPKVDGLHVVRATVADGDRPLSTALGTDSHLEVAEERAVERALRFVGLDANESPHRSGVEAIGTATLTPSYSGRPALPESYAETLVPEPAYTPLPLEELLPPEPKPEAKPKKKAPPALPEEPLDLSDIISQTDVE
ncbi:MAG: hypothetical protein HC918_11695 [Oscillatoriales cyanobacterium SM2_1_8]|nr:hypothetical protein [Oscillatoriales cyanobacterium SM2_1_8]